MEHDVNLNIHSAAPQAVWDAVYAVYSSMPHWAGGADTVAWAGEGIALWASAEPGGLQIAGTMPERIWNEWYPELKRRLSKALGYEIGEPEEGFAFPEWT